MENFRIAILDMYKGVPNEGMRCIKMLVEDFFKSKMMRPSYQIFDVRSKSEVPNIHDFDAFISSGGPGSPILEHKGWETSYFEFIEDLLKYNKKHPEKKHVFAICHSFQLLY